MLPVLRSTLRSIWSVLLQSGRIGPLTAPVVIRHSGRRGVDTT
jgi:hypothetical protein